jgi:uncharacterized protein YkwD
MQHFEKGLRSKKRAGYAATTITLLGCYLFSAGCGIVSGSIYTPIPTTTVTPMSTSTPEPYERCGEPYEMIEMVNHFREVNGQKSLGTHPLLNKSAQNKAEDMTVNHYFSHASPSFGDSFRLMSSLGIPYGWAGENLAKNDYFYPMDIAMKDLMASLGHRENMLNENFTMVGIGVSYDYLYGMCYYAQHFIGP